jgi:hypothetical protein
MRKLLICTAAIAALAAVPAQAKDKPAKAPKSCAPKSVGYNAKGVLVSQTLTQTAGADTAEKGDDRYSGDVVVNVTKANHKGLKGEQTLTLTNGRVKWYDANDDGTADVPAAGDRVGLHGKVTRLRKKCDSTGFEPTITLRKVDFKAAKTS